MNRNTKKIGKYLIRGMIAEGGMGKIYKAKHPTLKNDVILKKLTLSGNSSIVDRFKREAQLMLDFSNDNIVKVYDHFKEGNSYYIVMEYIDGISLEKLIEKNRFLPDEVALLIYRETCKALHYAHMKSVIHRDIKPDNVLISKNGEVKLTDFGIARSKNHDEEGLTSAGMTLGTPTYMSPEQIDDSSKVDKRTDIYSMGVMLYVMVTGKSPFPSNLIPQTINAIQKGKYIKPEKHNPKLSSAIKRLIRKGMHCRINRRYDSVEQLVKVSGKKLKKYRTNEEINSAIREYAYKKQSDGSGGRKGNLLSGILKGISAVIAASLIAGGLLFYLHLNGYHYEYLYPHKYGAIKIILHSRKSYKQPEELYKKIAIYKKVKGKYGKETSTVTGFKISDRKKYFQLVSGKLYLPSGRYRIKVYFENQLYQRDFYLYPRIIQREKKATADAALIEIFNREMTKLPVELDYSISDNNLDITKQAKLYIRYGSTWLLWDDYKKNRIPFVSGNSYYFKAVSVDYYPGYASVFIEPHQTHLNLQLELNPIPGYIFLMSSARDYRFSINNSEYYHDEQNGEEAKRYSLPAKRFARYSFPPGDYVLQAELDKNNRKTVRVNVTSGSRTMIKIIVDHSKKSILFSQKIGGRYVNID